MSVDRGAAVTGPAVRTGWSREGSEFASRSSRPTPAAGACVAAMIWTAARSCACTQVSRRRTSRGRSVREPSDRCHEMCSGVILQRVQCPAGPPSPKLSRTELPSDDEVEVVTEWLAPPVKEGRSNVLESTSSPTHVPVIQRPADANSKTSTLQDREKVCVWASHRPVGALTA